MELRSAFASTLRDVRIQMGVTQEDFSSVSSRTNISLLERRRTVPTLEKLEQICSVLDIHPLTMMSICYSRKEGVSMEDLMQLVANEIDALPGLVLGGS